MPCFVDVSGWRAFFFKANGGGVHHGERGGGERDWQEWRERKLWA